MAMVYHGNCFEILMQTTHSAIEQKHSRGDSNSDTNIQFKINFIYQTKHIIGYGHGHICKNNSSDRRIISHFKINEPVEATAPLINQSTILTSFTTSYLLLESTLSSIGLDEYPTIKIRIIESLAIHCQKLMDEGRVVVEEGRLIVIPVTVKIDRSIYTWMCECRRCILKYNNRIVKYLDRCTVDGEGGTCTVCLDEFQVGSEVLRIPHCAHIFHKNCIVAWLQRSLTCPVCRSQLVPDCMLSLR
ncbi:uncharacterized protein LOC133030062 [Cannabis sativa]|uniref:uncharacterized protein LOC133030062 n=1 Tax=Cannabis sativa TaxID=3483 RepID=UPI0029CA12EA|nr:uncharacterized protein LOC133030062 [Cannabis sativa]